MECAMIKRLFKFFIKTFMSPNVYAKYLGVRFGNKCKFSKFTNYGSEPMLISIGNNFYSSLNVSFITHDGSVNVLRNIYKDCKDVDIFMPINIGNNVFLGYGCILLPGVRIGDNVVVGAGSVVKGILKDNSVYAGVPARYICSIDEYRSKNINNFVFSKNMSAIAKSDLIQQLSENNMQSTAINR